ncbi:hypothetical protein [Paracraurococcus lichenis]|uniref:Uncharacterized protein n=1 Tax=Paracraurococcus lichenis TaxID=3064888 RepID=A0ABT9E829_9PROT|nr:hypothetical protein [Paracraurococcus sp. LOR1-02]MDO9712357.1 hypothetical protein [Paracraurococcus sp. LOR1-02]
MPSGAASPLACLLDILATVIGLALGVALAAVWVALQALLWTVRAVAFSVVR